MTHDTRHDIWTDRLSEYLDAELTEVERAELEAHLAGCARCREVLATLRDVVGEARALEPAPPATDLWPGVALAISRTTAPRRVSFSVPQLIAAGIFIALIGGLSVLAVVAPRGDARETASGPSGIALPAVNVPLEDVTLDRATADLLEALTAQRDALDPRTVEVVERSLATIDRAIVEARAALAEDPGNVYLSDHLVRERRLKLAVLRQFHNLAEVRP